MSLSPEIRPMHFAHLTLPTRHVERTCAFFVRTLDLALLPTPPNSPVPVYWLDLGRGQSMHVFYVEDFEVSRFESEFGRHIALFHPVGDFPAIKERLIAEGAELVDSLRPTPFERFFFREPINGYFFEVIDSEQWKPGA
jgi:catechol 2,3-dioxygenase-like lactoylglutathione lyase family enzyme